MPSPQHLHDIYAPLLIFMDRSRGYPLWNPEPDSKLPKSCRDEGLRIGDVGVVKDGSFDVLFNICLPKDHPLNQWGGVPTTFKQVPISQSETCLFSGADNDGCVIPSRSIHVNDAVRALPGNTG
jgi:hypothetical protein